MRAFSDKPQNSVTSTNQSIITAVPLKSQGGGFSGDVGTPVYHQRPSPVIGTHRNSGKRDGSEGRDNNVKRNGERKKGRDAPLLRWPSRLRQLSVVPTPSRRGSGSSGRSGVVERSIESTEAKEGSVVEDDVRTFHFSPPHSSSHEKEHPMEENFQQLREELLAPIDDGTLLTDDGALLYDDGALPTNDETLPTDDGALLADDGALPTDNGAMSMDDAALPIDNKALFIYPPTEKAQDKPTASSMNLPTLGSPLDNEILRQLLDQANILEEDVKGVKLVVQTYLTTQRKETETMLCAAINLLNKT
ncbi:hypothetical protein Sjap_025492 [Stephania japonica]|uniref:Uncharacterized protein n=1 Tax=Stephania japonica TaxID=461633 RepID=A0AAP0HI00_9MAGN